MEIALSLSLCISETVMAGGRARTRYWFSSSSLLGVYEVGVMKQDSRGFIRPMSSSKLKSPVKIPYLILYLIANLYNTQMT